MLARPPTPQAATKRDPNPAPEMRKSDQMRRREESRKKLAETEKKDAAD